MRLGASPVDVTGRRLTASEVIAFLARHPSTAARVAYHNTTSAVYCYPVGQGTLIPGAYEWERERLGVPWDGLAVEDSALGGTVTIFPDVNCNLRYSLVTGASAAAIASEIEKPAFQSPTGGSVLEDVRDLAEWAVPIITLVSVAFAWKAFK